VVVYRVDGRQRKQAAATFSEACAIKLARDAEARDQRRGTTLHAYALAWLERYAGSGHDSVRENTRREYRRLLVNFALSYFDREVRICDLDRARVQQFVDWLTTQPGRNGRLRDRSIANTITPLRLALDAAVAEGLLDVNPFDAAVLPRRRAGRAWEMKERRFLTREELGRLLDEAPSKWRPLFDLLAATGLRISEAIALRWSDLPRRTDAASAGQPGDRQGCRRRTQVAARQATGAAAARTGRDPERAPAHRRARRRLRVPWAQRRALRSRSASPARVGTSGRTSRPVRRRVSHAAPHLRIAADRVRAEPAALAALDGTSLTRVHARGLWAPARRR
jgi:integrase